MDVVAWRGLCKTVRPINSFMVHGELLISLRVKERPYLYSNKIIAKYVQWSPTKCTPSGVILPNASLNFGGIHFGNWRWITRLITIEMWLPYPHKGVHLLTLG